MDFLKNLLPHGYGVKIKEKLGLEISERHIQRIIDAGQFDQYGVLEEAIRMAEDEQNRREELQKRLDKLSIVSTPNPKIA